MNLRNGDLHDLVDKIIEIDSYKSKMGSDEEIVTIALSTKTLDSANDLVSFLESGYSFVLDADATSGEQSDGLYRVYVELQRQRKVSEQIMELADGILKLTDLEKLKFRYYKNFRSMPLTKDNLDDSVPTSASDYKIQLTDKYLENYKNFFNKSYVDSVVMENDDLTIKKIYADPVRLRYIKSGPVVETINSLDESFNANDFAEIIFLSKYVGDYNITKYGNKFVFENDGYGVVFERL